MKNLNSLKKKLEGVFKNNPKVKKIVATTDGQCWLEGYENLATDYAMKKGVAKHTFTRENYKSELEKLESKGGKQTKKEAGKDDKQDKGNYETITDRAKVAVKQGLENGVLTQNGSWISLGEDSLGNGHDNTVEYLGQNPKILERVEKALDNPEQSTHKTQ